MSTQQIATLLGATCCARLATMLCRVATCWVLLAQIWPSSNLSQQPLNMLQHGATGWPNARNMLRPTMLRYVALTCCDRLAGALNSLLLPWRRLLSAMLVPKQTRSIERSCSGSRNDWDKLIGLYRIPSGVFATRRIWGRTDYRVERNNKIKAISRGDTESEDVFNNERVFGKHFVSGKPAP